MRGLVLRWPGRLDGSLRRCELARLGRSGVPSSGAHWVEHVRVRAGASVVVGSSFVPFCWLDVDRKRVK